MNLTNIQLLQVIKNLYLFFKKHKLKSFCTDKKTYFQTFESNVIKTSIHLEIDQIGSGPTLVALVTKNKKLAKKCNLL